ncbi:MAG: phosphatidate cytidylyltransferase [Mucilaginibacter sp.]
MKKLSFLLVFLVMVFLSSCSVITGIFKAGVAVGIIVIVIIIAILIWIISLFRK